ncbi:MAG TPA: hypothetical protein VIT45_13365 [Allosphingosinicella sp.]
MKAKHYGVMLLAIGGAMTASATLAKTDARPGMKGKSVVTPGSRPVRDSRGNIVISDPAVTPRGANEPVGSQTGVSRDPKVVFAPQASTEEYQVCSKTVTDNCVQVWEPPRRLPECPGDPDCPT